MVDAFAGNVVAALNWLIGLKLIGRSGFCGTSLLALEVRKRPFNLIASAEHWHYPQGDTLTVAPETDHSGSSDVICLFEFQMVQTAQGFVDHYGSDNVLSF